MVVGFFVLQDFPGCEPIQPTFFHHTSSMFRRRAFFLICMLESDRVVLLVALQCPFRMIVVLLERSVLQVCVFGHYRNGTVVVIHFFCGPVSLAVLGRLFLCGEIEVASTRQTLDTTCSFGRKRGLGHVRWRKCFFLCVSYFAKLVMRGEE